MKKTFTVMGQTSSPATSSPSTAVPARSAGEIPMIKPEMSGDFGRIMEWADEVRKLGVRTNAETPPMQHGREFGAEGIGLCRTEHMFFDSTASPPCAR
jgi:phosphoenolpyruvate synthase/pyruvate phosphate dikinase